MRKGHGLRAVGLGVAALFWTSSARATDIVRFSADVPDVQKGQVLDVEVGLDFDDLTLGGGFDLSLSPALFSFEQFEFDPDLGDDPAFRLKPPDDASSGLLTIAFGSFSGLTGNREIGILQVVANQSLVLGSGNVLLSAIDDSSSAGPFVDTVGSRLSVRYDGLLGTAVPEPSALVLLSAGVAGIATKRDSRRHSLV
ncbi:MAG TPA: PEP-CTERM sorting domain-containing protein [Solirubrobacteraceae bacterium]|nr:PEP-CTERM sorting domain-containing protein [Solirubrobacteraceae bacterium]